MRRPLTVLAGTLALAAVAAPASAEWMLPGAGSGTATATALAPASAVTASAVDQTVTITWTAGGNPPGTVHRVKRGTTVLGCTASPCTDSGVQAGTHTYSVEPTLATWTGPAGTATVTVSAPDTTGPTITPVCPDDKQSTYTVTGQTKTWETSCKQRIRVTVADPSGIKADSVKLSARNSAGVWLNAAGEFKSPTEVSLTALYDPDTKEYYVTLLSKDVAKGSYTVRVAAEDTRLNPATKSYGFTID